MRDREWALRVLSAALAVAAGLGHLILSAANLIPGEATVGPLFAGLGAGYIVGAVLIAWRRSFFYPPVGFYALALILGYAVSRDSLPVEPIGVTIKAIETALVVSVVVLVRASRARRWVPNLKVEVAPRRSRPVALTLDTRVPMNHGGSIPMFGLGTWAMKGKKAVEAIRYALDLGYRLIDTASLYRNEQEVGEAIRASRVPRDDVFITTKVWNSEQGYESTLRACNASLGRLGMDYVDLYLIHSPSGGNRQETWRALLTLREEGQARAIGVSNYGVPHLDELRGSPVTPAVNQIELTPFLQPRDIVGSCRQTGIVVEAYSPLTRGERLRDKSVARIAAKHGRTPVQVLLRWGLQHGFVEIPKSIRPEHIRENADVFDFALAEEEMAALDALDEDFHVAWNPTRAP